MHVLSLLSNIVDRKYVRTRLRAEKVLSNVAEVIGTVLASVALQRALFFRHSEMPSLLNHILYALVTLFSLGVASLIKSTRSGSCLSRQSQSK